MSDPTWTRTCPCGEKVSVNMLGQHHHNDCEHNPIHPGCCDDPDIRRVFYWSADAGVECHNCGEEWKGDKSAYRQALTHRLTDAGEGWINGKLRSVIYGYNNRLLESVTDAE